MAIAFGGCSKQQDHKGMTPLVEVAGKFLYQEDLQAALPLSLTPDDSVLFAENYIRNWVEDILIYPQYYNLTELDRAFIRNLEKVREEMGSGIEVDD